MSSVTRRLSSKHLTVGESLPSHEPCAKFPGESSPRRAYGEARMQSAAAQRRPSFLHVPELRDVPSSPASAGVSRSSGAFETINLPTEMINTAHRANRGALSPTPLGSSPLTPANGKRVRPNFGNDADFSTGCALPEGQKAAKPAALTAGVQVTPLVPTSFDRVAGALYPSPTGAHDASHVATPRRDQSGSGRPGSVAGLHRQRRASAVDLYTPHIAPSSSSFTAAGSSSSRARRSSVDLSAISSMYSDLLGPSPTVNATTLVGAGPPRSSGARVSITGDMSNGCAHTRGPSSSGLATCGSGVCYSSSGGDVRAGTSGGAVTGAIGSSGRRKSTTFADEGLALMKEFEHLEEYYALDADGNARAMQSINEIEKQAEVQRSGKSFGALSGRRMGATPATLPGPSIGGSAGEGNNRGCSRRESGTNVDGLLGKLAGMMGRR